MNSVYFSNTLHDASDKSLVDRALATALAVSGNQKSAAFDQFKKKVDLAKSLVKSSEIHDWSRFHNDAGINAIAVAVDAIVATARLTQEKLQNEPKKSIYLAT